MPWIRLCAHELSKESAATPCELHDMKIGSIYSATALTIMLNPERMPPMYSSVQGQPLPLGVQKGVVLRACQAMDGRNTALALGFTPLFLINV